MQHGMYPLPTILSFLLSGVNRIAPDERADALCSMLGGLLPQMSEADIVAARSQVVTQFWASPEFVEEIVDVIDGHLALRAILASPDADDDDPESFRSRPDYEL
jgi:hypothetical protein